MIFSRSIYFLVVIFLHFSANVFAGHWEHETYSSAFGIRNYHVFIPENLSAKVKPALLIMLHGCDQTPQEFAKGSRIESWAEKEKFIVLMPEQNILYNPFKCWNWILPANNSRIGEPNEIVNMLDLVITKFTADESRVYAAGMSAGASMVSILGNCFPEKFKALASHDGTQYYASATGLDFSTVVLYGASVLPEVAASVGNKCSIFSSNRPTQMPMILFHGMNSPLMSALHAVQIETEMNAFNDYLDNNARDNSYFKSSTIVKVKDNNRYGYTLYKTINNDNETIIERYMINHLNHAWSGGVLGKYNDPKGPDASELIINFFKQHGL